MKIKNYTYILLLLFILFSCRQNKTKNIKIDVLGGENSFEMDKIDFNEDVLSLYSKVSTNNNLKEIFKQYDAFPNLAVFDDKEILFKIFEIKSLDILIPKNPFGFEFKSNTIDSLAKFHNLYFDEIKSLTNLDRKLIATKSYSRYKDENQRDSLLATINQIYGNPFMKTHISDEYNINSYSWVTSDRLIEIRTSFGHSFEVSTTGESENYKYFRLDLLIIDNEQLKSLVRAHRHYFDDNFKLSYRSRLVNSDFLPQIIGIKDFYLDNTGQKDIE